MSDSVDQSNPTLNTIEPTDDWVTSRAGLGLYQRYLEGSGLLDRLEDRFGYLREIDKGLSVRSAFKQLMCFFTDGTGQHLVDFDRVQGDPGYAATLETVVDELGSSHAFKRFFQKFPYMSHAHFRPLLRELFVKRLNHDQPDFIVLFMDTMVMDNDDAKKREGVEPSYQGTKGFQPFQVFWRGLPIDAVFRGGSKHSNHGETAYKALEHVIEDIRDGYDESVPIVVRFDSGFFDQKLFGLLEERGVGYVGVGKGYESLVEYATGLPDSAFEPLEEDKGIWDVAQWADCRESWDRFRRVVHTRPVARDDQHVMRFHPEKRYYYTNLGRGEAIDDQLREGGMTSWLEAKGIVRLAHRRGAEELHHRRLKEFGWEQLPFRRFAANMALYYVILVAFFTFRTFQRDIGDEVFPEDAYPRTIRRRWIDVAGKIIRHSGRRILQVAQSAYESLQFEVLWKRCNAPPALV